MNENRNVYYCTRKCVITEVRCGKRQNIVVRIDFTYVLHTHVSHIHTYIYMYDIKCIHCASNNNDDNHFSVLRISSPRETYKSKNLVRRLRMEITSRTIFVRRHWNHATPLHKRKSMLLDWACFAFCKTPKCHRQRQRDDATTRVSK